MANKFLTVYGYDFTFDSYAQPKERRYFVKKTDQSIHFFKEPAFKYHQYLIVKVKKCLAGSIVLAMAEHHCAINVVMR